ncbi:hypothetical protein [Pseudomonas sp. TWR3-1-1]|uniref:hypothetical protein n=1 Tax=Pseudomonas sp. TWR3-1-1 TaxID=2804633 RepID=UPI003CECD0C9
MQEPSIEEALLKAVEALNTATQSFRSVAAQLIKENRHEEAKKILQQADEYDRFVLSVCEVKNPLWKPSL